MMTKLQFLLNVATVHNLCFNFIILLWLLVFYAVAYWTESFILRHVTRKAVNLHEGGIRETPVNNHTTP